MKNSIYRTSLILILLILLQIHIPAQNGWTKIASMQTYRAGASACVINDSIYVIGGITRDAWGQYLDVNVNEIFDPIHKTWLKREAMPTARSFLYITNIIDTNIYAFGGGYPIRCDTNEVYNTKSNKWTTKNCLPFPWAGIAGAVVDGKIYLMGGNLTSRKCYQYDPAEDSFNEISSLPEDGCAGPFSVTVYNGLIYAFGGTDNYPDTALSAVCIYNPQTDKWTKMANEMPTARYWLKTFLVDDKIYAIGGCNHSNSSLPTVEVYDPLTDMWESRPDMPESNTKFGGVVYDNKIYTFGGTYDWVHGGDKVWVYDPLFHTDITAGNVSGTWTHAKSPYYINGEITIPNDSTLTIEPGVRIVFMGHYKFNVQGRLLAMGTQQDSIHFTAENKNTGWHGIRFINTSSINDTSKLVYCSFKYGKANTGSGWDRCGGAICIHEFDKVFISNSLFESNMNNGDLYSTAGAAIFVEQASPIVTNNSFLKNTGTTDCSILFWQSNGIISNNIFSNNSGPNGPIFCCYNAPVVSNNIISHNVTTRSGGIFTMTSTAIVTNNIIFNNSCFGHEGESGGIKSYEHDKSIFINNTIVYNSAAHGGGFCCNGNADPILINNIIWGNTSPDGNQVNFVDMNSDPIFLNNNIQGGKEEFRGLGAGINYTGLYENNIDVDPLFKDTSLADYSLSDASSCIGAGIESIEISGVVYNAPLFCKMGNQRPNPSGTNPDLGACESPLGRPTDIEYENVVPSEFALYQNYPNPFNPLTNIKYSVPAMSVVTLKIYDILGNLISVLINEEKSAGIYEITWYAINQPSGVYFYQLKAREFVETKKMLLLK